MMICDQYAYFDRHLQPLVYTEADIRGVVAYAKARGVRVVPEFDLPGHISGPLCGAMPHLCAGSPAAPDPSNEHMWKFVETVLRELVTLFPEQYFHAGGDEFRPEAWLESPLLAEWAFEKHLRTPEAVLNYFYHRYQLLLGKLDRKPMFWDEFFWTYDAPTPVRSKNKVLPGTSASVRGISGDSGAEITTEYNSDQNEWLQTLAEGIPVVNTGISEMWYLDRVGKVCENQPGGRDPSAPAASYFWQMWNTYHGGWSPAVRLQQCGYVTAARLWPGGFAHVRSAHLSVNGPVAASPMQITTPLPSLTAPSWPSRISCLAGYVTQSQCVAWHMCPPGRQQEAPVTTPCLHGGRGRSSTFFRSPGGQHVGRGRGRYQL